MSALKKINAIVLAGDKTAHRSVFGQNKLFLKVGGVPLLLIVLKALEGVERVDGISIAGPRASIEELLRAHSHLLKHNKPISLVEQRENMYKNFWAAFINTIPAYYKGMENKDKEVLNKTVLVLPCDMPLITTAEIDEFLDASPVDSLDYCLGMTEEAVLTRFHPKGPLPGIKMACLHLREGSFRVNNLHIVRPFKILNREYIEKIYECRYQKDLKNIARMTWDFIRLPSCGMKTIRVYMLLELSVLFRHIGLDALAARTRKMVSLQDVREIAGGILDTRIDIVRTTIGGAALDIDNEADLETLNLRFTEWSKRLVKE